MIQESRYIVEKRNRKEMHDTRLLFLQEKFPNWMIISETGKNYYFPVFALYKYSKYNLFIKLLAYFCLISSTCKVYDTMYSEMIVEVKTMENAKLIQSYIPECTITIVHQYKNEMEYINK